MSDYIEGQLVRLSAAFADAAGAAADPDSVTLKYLPASTTGAVTTTLIYPGAAEIVKDSTGNYHCDVPLDDPGKWVWRWESTGDAQAATQGEFSVARAAL